jgi:hypothetical protein
LLATLPFARPIGARKHDCMRNAFVFSSLVTPRPAVSHRPWRARACHFAVTVAVLLAAGLMASPAAAQNALPLASTTAVADFNADGRPDVAIAGHGFVGDGSNYRIDVRLSNGDRQSVSFASGLDTLRIRAFDVDNDHDIDIVVTPLLSHDVVGVWLNDGAGHFRRSVAADLPLDPAALTHTALLGGSPELVLMMPTSRRPVAWPPANAPPQRQRPGQPIPALSRVLPDCLFASCVSARAPPVQA